MLAMSKLSFFLVVALAIACMVVAVQADQQDSDWVTPALVETVETTEAVINQEEVEPSLIELSGSPIVRTGRGERGRRCKGGKCRRRKHGWGISPKPRRRVQQRLPKARLTGAAATLTRANVRCVLCQFVAQKLKNQLTGDAQDQGADAAASASLIEAFAFASVSDKSRVESTVSADATAAATSSAIPAMFESGPDSARRFRHTDVLAHRASSARFTQVRNNQPGPDTEATRAAYLKLYSTVYASFESLCAKRMPLAYLPYCNDMLKSYRFFAQGINYGDRAEQICMNGNFCDARAYVRRVTHNAYQREPGDA